METEPARAVQAGPLPAPFASRIDARRLSRFGPGSPDR